MRPADHEGTPRRPGGWASVLGSMLAMLVVPALVLAEEDRAAARLRAMASFLAQAKTIQVVVDSSYDVVQESGQKIEFGERRTMTLRRPDRARIDVVRRDGERRALFFDGTQLTAVDFDQKVFAVVPRPGTVDAAFAYYTQDLNMRLPLRELFASDLPQQLKGVLGTARLVAVETIGGVATEHVAFRGDTADLQIWIARDGDPLPQRIVITYRLAEGQPQFAADFSNWNLKPDVRDSLFVFTPTAGSEQIPILAPRRDPPGAGKRP